MSLERNAVLELEDVEVPARRGHSPPAERDQDRPREINLSGDTVTIKTADYPEEQRSLVRWLFAWAKEQGWSWKDLEGNSKLSVTTLYRVWTGKYRYPANHAKAGDLIPLDGICERIAHFKALAEERATLRRLPFVETSVFKRIDRLCRETLVMQSISMIYGESQIGKSWALKEVARRNNHGNTPYVLTPASAGVQGLIQAIGDACHITGRTSFAVLRERVTNFLDDSKLLIIDEVHEIFISYYRDSRLRCLSVLRQMQEISGCGLVLCGTNVFRHELEQGEFAQSLKQLRKRGILELQLEPVPSAKDLELIAGHYRLGAPAGEAAELVGWIGKEFGLGKYTRFLARASQLAAKRGERFAWRHFCDVVAIANRMKQEAK
jgi:DNA transposition AAA+ family ATPase